MLSGGLSNRWKHQARPGQILTCRLISRAEGGYTVEFGENKLRGFLPSDRPLALGQEVLLQFVGYRNQVAVFNAGFGTGS